MEEGEVEVEIPEGDMGCFGSMAESEIGSDVGGGGGSRWKG